MIEPHSAVSETPLTKILDNIERDTEQELLKTLSTSHRLDAAIGYFNLRGWRLLADAIDALPERPKAAKARILVGMAETPVEEMRRLARRLGPVEPDNREKARLGNETISEFRDQLQVGLPTYGDETALRQLLRQIESGSVEVKVFRTHRLHAKLYLCHRDDTAAPRVGYVGSSNLTASGLRDQGELNVDVLDGDATKKLAAWFEARWENLENADAVPYLAAFLKESWAAEDQLDPYLVYLKMAYHLSREAREGLIEYGLPATMQHELLDFQAAAVKIAARIVMQKGGAMIGDVVGLGKTLVGTAIARLLQEEQGFETLVICPKNLTDMWDSYLHRYEIRGKVESLSMVHKALPDARRYRLVIIDEAHNLRNEKRRDHRVIKDYIADNDSRALLLTATPYNKEFADLASQLSLFVRPDTDLGIRPERAISEVGEAKFALLCDSKTSTLGAFKRSEHLEDWQSLMSQYLVRRTRRFVEDNYAREDDEGRRYLEFGTGEPFYFPRRIPKPVDRALTEDDPAYEMTTDRTLDAIRDLKLPRYLIGDYLSDDFVPADDGTTRLRWDLENSVGGNLAGFTRITIFKRLSSSGPAFLSTLRRHRLRNVVAAYALEQSLPLPIGSVDNTLWAAETDQEPEDSSEGDGSEVTALFDSETETAAIAYDKLRVKNPKAIRWAPPQMFTSDLAADLRHDADMISKLLDRFGTWDAERDGKIAALEHILTEQYPNEKVLVFTEAADTARYVGQELARRDIGAAGVVTGDSEDPTALAHRFSPVSNSARPAGEPVSDELRVLISTDVLSEGQNLQDAHIIVNYDLPWAIVKLVQRAGRVDRIGQLSREVVVVSLLPAASVEEEIKLRGRVRRRLGEHARLLGSDETFFGDDNERQQVSGVYDESSSFGLEGVDDVDPVSMAYEIWRHASDSDPDLAQRVAELPNVVYSTKRTWPGPRDVGPGVLVHTLTHTGTDAFAFVEPDGQARRLTPQESLRLAECEQSTPCVRRLDKHHDLTEAALGGPLRTPTGRTISALAGVRGKIWNRFRGQMDSIIDNLLYTRDELEAALEAINNRPLYESATHRLAQAVRDRSDDNLAALVVDLHRDNRLCVPPTPEGVTTEPAIICTMGFRSEI